jgi:hypothetical protein
MLSRMTRRIQRTDIATRSSNKEKAEDFLDRMTGGISEAGRDR